MIIVAQFPPHRDQPWVYGFGSWCLTRFMKSMVKALAPHFRLAPISAL